MNWLVIIELFCSFSFEISFLEWFFFLRFKKYLLLCFFCLCYFVWFLRMVLWVLSVIIFFRWVWVELSLYIICLLFLFFLVFINNLLIFFCKEDFLFCFFFVLVLENLIVNFLIFILIRFYFKFKFLIFWYFFIKCIKLLCKLEMYCLFLRREELNF